MRRDRLTFAMMVGIPLMQLTLFGYAINTDPKHLPTVVLAYDHSDLTRSFTAALQNTGYYRVVRVADSRAEVDRMLEAGEALFAVTIPAGFTRDAAARRPPAAPGRGRRHRPGRRRQRAERPGHAGDRGRWRTT